MTPPLNFDFVRHPKRADHYLLRKSPLSFLCVLIKLTSALTGITGCYRMGRQGTLEG